MSDMWFDISTAPRDGTWFYAKALWFDDATVRVVQFADIHDRFPIHDAMPAWTTEPTQWRPLPTDARIAELEADRDEWKNLAADKWDELTKYRSKFEAAEQQLAEARDQALEEAAAWLDTEALSREEIDCGWEWSPDYPRIAAHRIRAMKGAKP